MKTLYDMSTGRILETPGNKKAQIPDKTQDLELLPALRLQEFRPDHSSKNQLPHDLSIADLDCFLGKMG